MAQLKDTLINGDLMVTGSIHGAIIKANYLTGFDGRKTSWGWGMLIPGNGYTQITAMEASAASVSDKGTIAFATKKMSDTSGQLSVQIDGLFYQSEGRYQVLDTSSTLDAAKVSGTVGNATNAAKINISGGIGTATPAYLLATTASGTGNQSVVRSTDAFIQYDTSCGTWMRLGNASYAGSASNPIGRGTLSLSTGAQHYVDLYPDILTTSNPKIMLPTASGSLIALQNKNEVNMDGYQDSTNVWFNYKGKNNTADTTYPCNDYYFCNRSATSTGYTSTTLHAGKYDIYQKVTLQYNTSTNALDFVFAS